MAKDLVFVTGASGFVGANLVRLLLHQGYGVRALLRSSSSRRSLAGLDLEIVEGDLHSPDLKTQMQGCRYLFHVAAHYSLWRSERAELMAANVEGTRQVLAAARQAGVERTVYTSSVAAIGASTIPVNESYQSPPEKLIGAYKLSKYLAEQVARQAANHQDLVIVNPTTPIGAWDAKPTPTGEIILRFLRRQMPFYLDTGLNFVHVEDVAWGHLLALTKGKRGDRYILGHQNLSLKQFLDQLEQITGIPAPQRQIPQVVPLIVAGIDELILARLGKQPSLSIDSVRMAGQKMYYDSTKAVKELGLPQTAIQQAIACAVSWYRQ
ncbi:MAG: NAD-dependent epimerase/dehydratase family protein [Pseudanabaenaceae cyanobacterium bins.68]|nr:NAD-dependent epimerase/dehydratase family protein [Pseudanabaenaceae cyanobacterium bins.68]